MTRVKVYIIQFNQWQFSLIKIGLTRSVHWRLMAPSLHFARTNLQLAQQLRKHWRTRNEGSEVWLMLCEVERKYSWLPSRWLSTRVFCQLQNVVNLRIPWKAGNFKRLETSQRLCSTELFYNVNSTTFWDVTSLQSLSLLFASLLGLLFNSEDRRSTFLRNVRPREHIPEDSIHNHHRRYYYFVVIIILSGVRLSPLGTAATIGQLYQPQMIDDGYCGSICGMKIDWQGKPKYSEKICPSATLSTTNSTWPDPSLNPGRRGGKLWLGLTIVGTLNLTDFWNTVC
jgi:hypothetical protein